MLNLTESYHEQTKTENIVWSYCGKNNCPFKGIYCAKIIDFSSVVTLVQRKKSTVSDYLGGLTKEEPILRECREIFERNQSALEEFVVKCHTQRDNILDTLVPKCE